MRQYIVLPSLDNSRMVSHFFVFTGRDLFSLEIQFLPFSCPSLSPPPVLIVDRASTICYPQVTPELTPLPDIEAAFKFVLSLVTAGEDETDLGTIQNKIRIVPEPQP